MSASWFSVWWPVMKPLVIRMADAISWNFDSRTIKKCKHQITVRHVQYIVFGKHKNCSKCQRTSKFVSPTFGNARERSIDSIQMLFSPLVFRHIVMMFAWICAVEFVQWVVDRSCFSLCENLWQIQSTNPSGMPSCWNQFATSRWKRFERYVCKLRDCTISKLCSQFQWFFQKHHYAHHVLNYLAHILKSIRFGFQSLWI